MAKFNDIRELAQQNARWVSNSPKDWMNYLDVAARLYRYSFKDTLLIHAQRPDATACAELEVWNKKMNRWVNRGAKGIALLDDASPRAKLRYVFDIADTHLVQGGRTPILWRIDDSEHQQMILDHLADTYALTQTDSMNAALMELAQQLTAENLEEAMDGLEYEVADTFLEGLDEDNLRVRFRELMTNSIFYTLSRRCEQEPLEVLEDEDFIRIVDFNQLPVLTFLGNAVSEQCEAVLRDIGREMQKIYRKEVTEHLAKTADSLYNTSTDFSTLKRETETNITEGGKPYGTDLSPQGGLPVSEPDRTGRADEHWEVRDVAQDLSEGKQEELVSEYADERQAESASGADRRAGGEPDGRTDREPEREVSGSEQGNRTDGMGGTSEQSDRDGGRDRAEGIGVQLTADTTEQDLSEAEEEIASAFSLPSLPTVEQQIRAIEAPMQAQYADEITIPAEVVDEILRTGSNRSKSQLRLIYNFMTEQTPEEYTAFVQKEYGEGGKGFEIGGTKYAVWFDELGMQIAVGDTVRNAPKNKAFLSWEDVSCRIHQLLQQGEYAPKSVLDAARGNALHEHAEALSYMERDMAEGVAEMVFADTSIFSGGYPELTERLAKLIDQPEFLADLNERLLGLAEAYAEDLDDAMSCYQQVPNFHLKALGVEKTPDPLPGSLDIVQCKNGIDTIVEDYKKVPGWDNPYIQNHVVALVAEALKVQDVAVAYEINDGYFNIQTSEDGYDYTLYNKDFTVMDGGIIEVDGYRPVQEMMEEVLAEHGHSVSECGVISTAYLQEQSYRAETQRAEAMKEKLAAEKPAPEANISFYVAECAEFPVMGEFHDNLTLEQALEIYDKIPAERMNGIKSIGFSLEDGSIYSGMFDLMVGGEVQAEVVNHIQHYRESPLVQKAISDMKTLLEKRQASKELEERPNTRQSVREALKNRKKAQEQQPHQEQAKPKKAKKKGEMEL